MSAREKDSLTKNISKLGIIAGGGVIPRQLQQVCANQNIETVTIGIKGATDHVSPDFWTRIGTSGKTIAWLEKENVKDVVLIGAVKRPSLMNLWPDWETAKFFFKIWFKSLGDNTLLSAMRVEFSKRGITVHGVHKFLPELLMPEGLIGYYAPKDGDQVVIQIGIQQARKLGMEDIGQAVIMKGKDVVAYEDARGTSSLIKRHGCEGAILVKTCKPQQDRDLDLPTIGPETVRLCAEKKMAGIVAQAGASLLVEREEVVRIADANKIFVMGVTLHEPK